MLRCNRNPTHKDLTLDSGSPRLTLAENTFKQTVISCATINKTVMLSIIQNK